MTAQTRTSPILALTIVVLLSAACAPPVMHGPRVEPGVSGAAHLDVGTVIDSGNGPSGLSSEMEMMPNLYAGLRNGWVFPEGGPAASLGFQMPILGLPFMLSGDDDPFESFGQMAQVDLYVQPHREATASTDYGAGVIASTAFAMPYFQYGRTWAPGLSWYTTQALVLGLEGDGAIWLPSVTIRDEGPMKGGAVNYTAGMGMDVRGEQGEWLVTLGVTAEFGLDRLKVGK